MKAAFRAKRSNRTSRSVSNQRGAPSGTVSQSNQASYTATRVKNQFGPILEQAIHGKEVVITKHGSPRAVMISLERFNALKHSPTANLHLLSRKFDKLFERMQTPRARAAVDRLFRRTPEELGQAAVAAVRKRD